MKLNHFTPENGFWPGSNTPQFLQLEYLINLTKHAHSQDKLAMIPHLGLFGEASTGKTSTAKHLASILGYSVELINGSSLTKQNFTKTMETLVERPKEDAIYIDDAAKKMYAISAVKRLIIIDEAHELPKAVQNLLLTTLEGSGIVGQLFPEPSTKTRMPMSAANLTFVFITTDSSKLAYPLTTRLHSVVFDQYSEDDVCQILRMKNAKISREGAVILAKCSKLVPRVAIRYAKMLTTAYPTAENIPESHVETFVKTVLGMEPNGIDATDKRILLYLHRNKKQSAPIDQISLESYQRIYDRLSQKTSLSPAEHRELNVATFQIQALTEKLARAEYTPKSREDISLACRILDTADLEVRLSYLEKLNLVVKTSRGILLDAQYLADS